MTSVYALERRELTLDELRKLKAASAFCAELPGIFPSYESWRAFRRRHEQVLRETGAVIRLDKGDHVNLEIMERVLPPLLRDGKLAEIAAEKR